MATSDKSKAAEFKAANAKSPVVSGSAIGKGGEGCVYTLKDRSVWRLNAADCSTIGLPKWDL